MMVDTAAPAPEKRNILGGRPANRAATNPQKVKYIDPRTQPTTRASYISGSRRKTSSRNKLIIIVVLVLILAIAAFAIYIKITLNNILSNSNNGKPVILPNAYIRAYLQEQDLLTYDQKYYFVPFGLINYQSKNVSSISVNMSILNYTPPSAIYLLNVSDECWQNYCGNTTAIVGSMENYLTEYNLIKGPENITIISPSNVRYLPPDSVIVVIDGLLPSDFLQQMTQNTTVLDHLLAEHTSIVYVGQNFSTVVTHHGLSEPIIQALPYQFPIPGYLSTFQRPQPRKPYASSFYFNSMKYGFLNGSNYTYLTYENVYNGSIVAFPNTPLSGWANPKEEGHDLAKAIQELFWLPNSGYGSRVISLGSTKNSTGEIGVLLNATRIPLNATYVGKANNGTLRIRIAANGTYYPYISNSTYQYLDYKPRLYYNGSLGMSNSLIINQSTSLNLTLITGSQVPIKISFPYIELYNLNMTPVFQTELPALTNVSGNYTFYDSQTFDIAPGRGYILKMLNNNQLYSAAYFRVAPLSISLAYANYSSDHFIFDVNSNKQPLTNIKYNMSINGEYLQSGVIINNTLVYSTPLHTPALHGELNFTLDVAGSKSYYTTYYYLLPFGVSPEYIETGVVIAIMLVMIMFVRAPHRDEFYIDVPNLPEEKKNKISIKAKDIVAVFDKLNTSYRWRYMPLSKAEIRSAIASNIKSNSISVGLTYSNVEKILDQLLVNKYLVSADELYAPVEWVEQSKHDIEYLATFKKLRLYLVTHAYIFTDLDMSTTSDIVATFHTERKYIIIYSKTSQFKQVPVYTGSTTYIAFLNSYRLEEFKNNLYNSASSDAEELKMYISADLIRLMDADNPEGLTS